MAVDYASRYYDSLTASALQSTKEIVPIVLEFVSPKSVVDVGCGGGAWLAEFQRHGVSDVLGIDGPWVGRGQLQIPPERFLVADIGQPIDCGRTFDLAVCLEAAEHVPASSAETLVDSLTRLSKTLLFSAAIPFQGGENHFNEQWPEYWLEKFERRGFQVVDCLRHRLWRNPKVEYWYSQNIMLFVESSVISASSRLQAAASGTRREQLALVHPRAFLEGSVRAKGPNQLLQVFLGSVKRAMLGRRT